MIKNYLAFCRNSVDFGDNFEAFLVCGFSSYHFEDFHISAEKSGYIEELSGHGTRRRN